MPITFKPVPVCVFSVIARALKVCTRIDSFTTTPTGSIKRNKADAHRQNKRAGKQKIFLKHKAPPNQIVNTPKPPISVIRLLLLIKPGRLKINSVSALRLQEE
jgi:hypothetical protein